MSDEQKPAEQPKPGHVVINIPLKFKIEATGVFTPPPPKPDDPSINVREGDRGSDS